MKNKQFWRISFLGGLLLGALLAEPSSKIVLPDIFSDGMKSSDGKSIRGFYVAGADKKFVEAKVTLEKESLLLSAFGNIRPYEI